MPPWLDLKKPALDWTRHNVNSGINQLQPTLNRKKVEIMYGKFETNTNSNIIRCIQQIGNFIISVKSP